MRSLRKVLVFSLFGVLASGFAFGLDDANAAKIAAGERQSCAVTATGGVVCWGQQSSGSLGNGQSKGSSFTPVQVVGIKSGATAVAGTATGNGGSQYACAIVSGGVKCWGTGGYGTLGNGAKSLSLVPVQVTGLTSGVTAISLNATHACAIQAGAVKCWGSGWLGAGKENKTSPVPVQVTGLTAGATALAVGWRHACALVSGVVWCWGYNSVGQLGVTRAPDVYTPVAVTGLSGPVSSIAAGVDFTCALAGGAVSCWGSGSKLGNGGTMKKSYVPVPVTGLESGVTAISANWSHACAIKAGAVWCWGDNNNGQLGNGAKLGGGGASSLVPVRVAGVAGVTSVAVGKSHTCAIAKGGVRWCWGSNAGGQLGVAAPSQSSVPVKVSSPKR